MPSQKEDFVVLDTDIAAVPKIITPEKARLWQQLEPAVIVIVKKFYSDDVVLEELAKDIVHFVFAHSGTQCKDLEHYLEDNLDTSPTDAKKIAVSIRAAASVYGNEFAWQDTVAALPSQTPAQKSSPQEDSADTAFAARLVKESGVQFKDRTQDSRFLQAVVARVKEVRNSPSTRALFMREIDKGGVGMTEAEADKMVIFIEKALKERDKVALQNALSSSARAHVHHDISLATDLKFPLEIQPPHALQTETPHALVAMEASGKPRQPAVAPRASSAQPPAPVPAPVVAMAPGQVVSSQPPAPTVVADIVPPKRLAGPLEELSSMRLIDFRRLSSKPEMAANKIKDRIVLLRDDSFSLYTKGIAAWQVSPLYEQYLAALQSAFSKSPLAFGASPEQMTKDEFLAILQLNRSLEY